MGVECPVCDKRVKQGFADCEQQREQLQSKNQRLVLALTVVATLAGRETVDYAFGLSSTVESALTSKEVEQDSSASVFTRVGSEPQTQPFSAFLSDDSEPLFPDLPAITPTLGIDSDPLPLLLPSLGGSMTHNFNEQQVVVPGSGTMVLLGLSCITNRRRS